MKTLADAEDMAGLRTRLLSLCGDEAALWGQMSVGEMVCHCREAFRGAGGARTLSPQRNRYSGPVMKFFGLRSPVRWPKGVPTVPELKTGQPGIVPAEFRRDRDGMLAAMEHFRTLKITAPHPIFGAMTTADWMRWGWLHTDHHLRQFGR